MIRKRSKHILACVAGAAILTVALLLGYVNERRATSFESPRQAYTLLRAAGYYCTTDQPDEVICVSFMVSRKPMTWEEASAMYRGGPIGATWKGRVWIIAQTPNIIFYPTLSDIAPRVWGKVWAFGDVELLDEIESTSFQ